ncbi:hypothetical protein CL634_01890 [bacterium]|nr:hypothetical protein [bacterium]|tara:strand:- start:618 stop:1022 length:405 start_codon:yes stop_codon:yes gene_type:complete
MITSTKVKVTTTGSAGSATGSAESAPFAGKILAVILVPDSALPSTTDTTVFVTKDGDKDVNLETIATFTNSGDTEGVIKRYPIVEADDGAGTSVADTDKTNVFVPYVTVTGVHIEVAQADALTDAVEIEIIYDA